MFLETSKGGIYIHCELPFLNIGGGLWHQLSAVLGQCFIEVLPLSPSDRNNPQLDSCDDSDDL